MYTVAGLCSDSLALCVVSVHSNLGAGQCSVHTFFSSNGGRFGLGGQILFVLCAVSMHMYLAGGTML